MHIAALASAILSDPESNVSIINFLRLFILCGVIVWSFKILFLAVSTHGKKDINKMVVTELK